MTKLESLSDFSKRHDRTLAIEGVERYARAECSDPFAFARAMAHLRQGCADTKDYGAEEDSHGNLSSVHRM